MDYLKDSKWIYLDKRNYDINDNEIVYFKKLFSAKIGNTLKLIISADSRYELYLNGHFVGRGPCRSGEAEKYYDNYDLSALIINGENVLAVRLCHFSGQFPFSDGFYGPTGIFRKPIGGLMVDGTLNDDDSILCNISSNNSWLCKKELGIKTIEAKLARWATTFEEFDGKIIDHFFYDNNINGWIFGAEISDSFLEPKPLTMYGQHYNMVLKPREIPCLYEEKRDFIKITKSNLNITLDSMTIPAHTNGYFDLDAGELSTGYIYITAAGKGAKIKLVYSESYYSDIEKRIKGKRDDASGEIIGENDLIFPTNEPHTYSTFMFRTFRFVRIYVESEDCDVKISDIHFLQTGYPLKESASFECNDKTFNDFWDISRRTLFRCMYDTYVDCPYYEQLQYILDTRLEALFSFVLSNDERLTKKAIYDFHSSLTEDGLLQARYPTTYRGNIPGFSLYFIQILEDFLMYHGDIIYIKRFIPTMDSVLSWFDRHLNEQGLVVTNDTWNFIDWVDEWYMQSVPNLQKGEGQTILSLMYAYSLKSAAFVAAACGRSSLSSEYQQRYSVLICAINEHCYDKALGFYTDGAYTKSICMHSQMWAVLCGAIIDEKAVSLIKKAHETPMPKPSYCMSFYYFRCLEITGLYNNLNNLLAPWKKMYDLGVTTWVEDPVTQRSDCHGWGSVPIYEFGAVILGVRPDALGFEKAIIKPNICELRKASGRVATKHGDISVSWKNNNGLFQIQGYTPVEATLILPDGSHSTVVGQFMSECNI